jgi:hypothetical protein
MEEHADPVPLHPGSEGCPRSLWLPDEHGMAAYWPSGHCVHSVQLPGGAVSTALLHWYAPGSLRFQNASPLVQLNVHDVPFARMPSGSVKHSPAKSDVLKAGSVQLAAADKATFRMLAAKGTASELWRPLWCVSPRMGLGRVVSLQKEVTIRSRQ